MYMGTCRHSFKNSSKSILMCPSLKLRNRHNQYPGSSHMPRSSPIPYYPSPPLPEVPPPELGFVSFPCLNNLLAWCDFELYENENILHLLFCNFFLSIWFWGSWSHSSFPPVFHPSLLEYNSLLLFIVLIKRYILNRKYHPFVLF